MSVFTEFFLRSIALGFTRVTFTPNGGGQPTVTEIADRQRVIFQTPKGENTATVIADNAQHGTLVLKDVGPVNPAPSGQVIPNPGIFEEESLSPGQTATVEVFSRLYDSAGYPQGYRRLGTAEIESLGAVPQTP